MTVDTLRYSEELEQAGVSSPVAKAHARALNRALQDGVATKADLLAVEGRLKADMQVMEERIYSKMLGYMAVQALAIIGLNAAMVGILLRALR